MKERIISIHSNDSAISCQTASLLEVKLKDSGFTPVFGLDADAELLIVIGGDGTLLEAIHNYDFPSLPIIGINTGHLGFFQELHPYDLDEFIFNYNHGKYSIQELSTVTAKVFVRGEEKVHTGLNEIIIRGDFSRSTHLNISIGGSFMEKFSGDGLLISTPAGSTAYNYSLGGSIVDPRLKTLQLTPMGPMNTTAYRSFTSSVLLPSTMKIGITPEYVKSDMTYVIYDGIEAGYRYVDNIELEYSNTIVKLMRFENYDFWNKVKTKFL